MADFNFTPWLETTPPIVAAPVSLPDNISKGAQTISDAINTYYGTKLQIAQQQAALRIARAQGVNAVQTARSGLPSPTFLVIGAFGLLAALALSGGKRR
jgi:hypothetical protein